MRKFSSSEESQNNNQEIARTLRIGKPAAPYARRSDPDAKDKNKDKSQSREMQTEDLMRWALGQGWKEKDLDPYFADLGLSGTLRPDQRPDMLRLFDNIDRSRYDNGTVICYQENRLFRDETQIYYNQFIQKCKEHDVVVVVISPYLMIYDFQDEFLTEMFRWKCKEAGDFIKRHIKGWMHPARERATRQGRWAGLGDIPMGYNVDFDPHSPTYKMFVPYEPHAQVIRWLFQRFIELGGDLSKLYRELNEKPVYFPPFNEDINLKNINKRKLKYSAGGYRLRTRTAVESILTNPHYIGYWSLKGIVVRKDNHEPLVDYDTFMFAFNRLSKYTLEGEIIEKDVKDRKFYHKDTELYFKLLGQNPPLLKDRITATKGTITVHVDKRYGRSGVKYMFSANERETWFENRYTELGITEIIDKIVVERLFQHVHEIGDMTQYSQQLAEKKAEKQRQLANIAESIRQIDIEQINIAQRVGKTSNIRMQELLEAQVIELENERQELIKAQEILSAEGEMTLRSLDEELQDLELRWSKYPSDKKIALINFLIREVVVDIVSPHWTRLQVLWLHSDWGREEMYFLGRRRGVVMWTEEENAILREHYETMPKLELMKLLPRRHWNSINVQAARNLGLHRPLGAAGVKLSGGDQDIVNSYQDREFMKENGILPNSTHTKWTPVSILMFIVSLDDWD